jgi:hypothetical protein
MSCRGLSLDDASSNPQPSLVIHPHSLLGSSRLWLPELDIESDGLLFEKEEQASAEAKVSDVMTSDTSSSQHRPQVLSSLAGSLLSLY